REIDRAVPLDDDIIWAVETLTFVLVGQDGALAVLLHALERPVAERAEHKPSLGVHREAIRAYHDERAIRRRAAHSQHRPAVPRTAVAALVFVNGHLSVGSHLVDFVTRDVREQEVAFSSALHPYGSFSESESGRDFLDSGVH